MTTKHTPVPWNAISADRGYIITTLDGCYDVAVVRNIGNQNNKPNARLISAAPDLLAALESTTVALEQLVDIDPNSPAAITVAKARAAIAKARGE